MRLSLFLLAFFVCTVHTTVHAGKNKDVICIRDTSIALSEKEALLILPGLGDGKKQRNRQKAYFCGQGFDVYIPDYIDKDGFEATYQNFVAFFDKYQLGTYKKLHVFSYILGSWTVNKYILKNGKQNIASIVYDRSPMQELAPELIVENIPRIAKFMFGKLPEDLARMSYPVIDTSGLNIGIIVESKATPILRFYEQKAKRKRSFHWGIINYQQAHDDKMYTYLNHDEMYTKVDVFGIYVLNFIKTGTFGSGARRNWYEWNSFEKLPKIRRKVWKYPALRGDWVSQKMPPKIGADSIYNYLHFDKKDGIIAFEILGHSSPVYHLPSNGNIPVKMDRKGTMIRQNSDDDIYPIQELPKQDNAGRWYFVLDGVKYWKQEYDE